MLKYHINLITVFLFVTTISIGNAQTSAEVFQGIQNYYSGNSFQHYIVNTQVYDEKGTLDGARSRRIEIKKQGSKMSYRTGRELFILNEEYMLNKNDDQSLIICNKNNRKSTSTDDLLSLDKVLSSYDSIYYQGIVNGQRHYIMEKENSMYSKIEIFLDLDSYKIDKMIYRYNEILDTDFAYMVIKLEYLKTENVKDSEQSFSLKPYVKIEQNIVFTTNKYKGYDLVVGEGLEYGNQ